MDGSEALEQRLSEICDNVSRGVRRVVPGDKLEAVYLGGGYGRGEGGVLRTEYGDAAYNDMEFWVFLRGNDFLNERRYGAKLHHLGEVLTDKAGIEVEFKIASTKKLKQSRPTMFAYDLAVGHRPVFGHGGLLADDKLRDATLIPPFEATRLLMNRCTGLLFSEERLRRESFGAAEADFIGRNHAKAQLAFGDVLLAACGQYHWSCRERNERLKKLIENPGFEASTLPFSPSTIYCHHALGVDFKLHPEKKSGSREMFIPLQTQLLGLGLKLWLWLESRRLNYEFDSARDYAFNDMDKCPETNPIRNRLVNLKTFGTSALLKEDARRYPRERLFNALTLLLWEPGTTENSFLLEKVQSELVTEASVFPELVAAYEKLWRKFN